jgi:hypothetical protein
MSYITIEISEWVGFDFDSNIGHSKGLNSIELEEIIEHAKKIPWVTIKRSKSGKGIHFYIPIENSPKITDRKEHCLFAKSILSMLSAFLGFDFGSLVDTSGTILWIYHIKQGKKAFETISQAKESLSEWPKNWKNYKIEKEVKGLGVSLQNIFLSEEHKSVIKNVKGCWWDAENNLLVSHTFNLKETHTSLSLRGLFFTDSTGSDCPSDHNCFCFPLSNGSWIIRRYGKGTKEHKFWEIDKLGWTYCYYNKNPTLSSIGKYFGGKQNSKNEWVFNNCLHINEIIKLISLENTISFPVWAHHRQVTLSPLKNFRLAIKFEKEKTDVELEEWLSRKTWWEKIIVVNEEEKELKPPDEMIRHIVAEGQDAGWYVSSSGKWNKEPRQQVKDVLSSMKYNTQEISEILGQCVLNPWKLVNHPFQPEYPGGRKWNKYAPQLSVQSKEGEFPTWKKMLSHLGNSLTPQMNTNAWCTVHSIVSGEMYLMLWVAALFQFPTQPLPYLFLYGPQNSGKSSLHEALNFLVNKGVVRAELPLTQQFNYELAGAILCITDEFNLAVNKGAYNKLKDWVTAKYITIRPMFSHPFQLPNTTHWMQVANNPSFCPMGFGDTRIVVIKVENLVREIPKQEFMDSLEEEASAFLHHILNLSIPSAIGRMRIPVLETSEKEEQIDASLNPVEQFITECCFSRRGHYIEFSEFSNRYKSWIDNNGGNSIEWSKRRISNSISLDPKMPNRGRIGGKGLIALGNLTFTPEEEDLDFHWIKSGDRLMKSEKNDYTRNEK